MAIGFKLYFRINMLSGTSKKIWKEMKHISSGLLWWQYTGCKHQYH